MSSNVSIILTGSILPDCQPRKVAANLARLLNTTEEKAVRLISGMETVVKYDIHENDIVHYISALNQAGAEARSEKALPPDSLPMLVTAFNVSSSETNTHTYKQNVPVSTLGLVAVTPDNSTAAEPETMICPACGSVQRIRMMCLACGVNMQKMNEELKQKNENTKVAESTPDTTLGALAEFGEIYTVNPQIFSLSRQGNLGRMRFKSYSALVSLVLIVFVLWTVKMSKDSLLVTGTYSVATPAGTNFSCQTQLHVSDCKNSNVSSSLGGMQVRICKGETKATEFLIVSGKTPKAKDCYRSKDEDPFAEFTEEWSASKDDKIKSSSEIEFDGKKGKDFVLSTPLGEGASRVFMDNEYSVMTLAVPKYSMKKDEINSFITSLHPVSAK